MDKAQQGHCTLTAGTGAPSWEPRQATGHRGQGGAPGRPCSPQPTGEEAAAGGKSCRGVSRGWAGLWAKVAETPPHPNKGGQPDGGTQGQQTETLSFYVLMASMRTPRLKNVIYFRHVRSLEVITPTFPTKTPNEFFITTCDSVIINNSSWPMRELGSQVPEQSGAMAADHMETQSGRWEPGQPGTPDLEAQVLG